MLVSCNQNYALFGCPSKEDKGPGSWRKFNAATSMLALKPCERLFLSWEKATR